MREVLLIVLPILLVTQLVRVDAGVTYVSSGCTNNGNYTNGSIYQQNLHVLFSDLSSQTSVVKFYNTTAGNIPNQVYGLYQCREDLTLDICQKCIQDAILKIVSVCPLYGEAVVWYYECMLRYANYSFFSSYETLPSTEQWNTDLSKDSQFLIVLGNTMNGLIKAAALNTPSRHFATAEANLTDLNTLYCLAQCTPDIDGFGCHSCLTSAFDKMSSCCNASLKAMVMMPSCQLRYDMSPFYNITYNSTPVTPPPSPSNSPVVFSDNTTPVTPPPSPSKSPVVLPGKRLKPSIIAGIAVAGSLGLLLFFMCIFKRKAEEVSRDIPPEAPNGSHNVICDGADNLGEVEFVQYDFATLKAATRDFSVDNKLGEGGFGAVYKGTLRNGQVIAIKRLSGNSGQGAKEFMTEVRLVAKLQHRNLVSLVGFCSVGEEKLLVYEFMPNTSLDRFLFDPKKRAYLEWQTRYKIIMGIARGLQYLHEDSRLTIIHRDLKPSNILLDKEMNPKIADFGMAKLFGGEQVLGNTSRVVGTYGYMAPEYMLTGDYSDKSDVYSFGIIVLEIVSGLKNRNFHQPSPKEDLLIHAWRLWNDGQSFELMDPTLSNSCSRSEVMRCIQIGLLCVQANAVHRSTMTAVVLMLTGSVSLPLPSPPAMSYEHYMTGGNQQQPSESYQSTTKSVTWRREMEEDLYPAPR